MTKNGHKQEQTVYNVHLKLRPPNMILVVDIVQCLNNLLKTGDESLFEVELEQWPTKLPVYDGCIIYQVVISVNTTMHYVTKLDS